MSITAPYNFVPLNKEVFYPEWSEQVSHDIPFSDGESGKIDITITTKSPVFIRDHENKEEFCHFINNEGAKEFYIPGSSIKGMVRSVLEIMSFSKIRVDEEKLKKPLSVRDMTNRRELVGSAIGCGFLVKDGENYYVEDSGKILTISHIDLQTQCDDIKKLESAKAKYEEFWISTVNFSTYKKMMDVGGRKIPKDMAKIDNNSKTVGTLVFTGDIGKKKHEFIFKHTSNKVKIDHAVFNNFKKAYFDNEDSIDGQYWKSKFKSPNTKIPIFYTKDEHQKINAIGLTQLFKLAYNKTLFEVANQNSDPKKLDLAETIFGTEKEKFALKGRVQFSHIKCTTERYEKDVDAILGTPNPTYYPNYIRQTDIKGNKVNKYKTLMDSDAVISGWKRYPQHNQIMKSIGGNDNEDVHTKFKPLGSETTFKGKLRFHNLKKAEIGALLSAITFHGQASYLHNIGMAKPLGYGKIEIKLEKFKYLKHTQDEYMKAFEEMMNSWEQKEYDSWIKSPQLRELFAMSSTTAKSNEQLAYQLLENPKPKYFDKKGRPEKNDFTGAKKEKEYLTPHSGVEYIPKPPSDTHKAKKTHPVKSDNKNDISNLFGGEAREKPKRKGLSIVKKADKPK